jgi:tetratricopeptide (TPR) repeat protein/DNA-binding XRE family transcriptional regulator
MASAQPRSFADLLRHYRTAAGLTQEELAEQAGVSARAICALEIGERRTPRKETVALLAKALGLTSAEQALLAAAARGRFPVMASREGTPDASSAHMPPSQRVGLPLVGRRQELSALGRHLACEGPPLLLFAGEPGIGKSRLLEESARQAVERGWTVVAGSCHRRSGQEPYAPFIGALTHVVSTRPPTRQRLDLHGCAWLVRLLPELAETVMAPAPSWTLPPEHERRLMFGAVARYLANIAQPVGTLLVLDDLQWAGGDALNLLTFLVREPAPRPLRIVGAFRDTDVGPRDPLPLFVGDLMREGLVARAALPPLDPEAARDLLSVLLSGEGGEAADAGEQGDAGKQTSRQRQIDVVLDRADGLPLFLVSCAQELRMGALAEAAAGSTVPWSARESIRQRVVVLPGVAQEVLAAAAVAGRKVPRPILITAAKASRQDEATILAGLDAACRARLLAETPDGWYVFTHDLVRETVVADLGGARRAALHRRIAEVLEALPRAEPQAAELAWHFTEGDEPARALPYAVQAGDQAEAKYAHADAEHNYAQAIKIARTCGYEAHEAKALERRADVWYRLGRYADAVSDLDAAAAIYRRLGDWERLVWATTQRAKAGDPLGQVAESLVRVEALAITLAAVAVSRDRGSATMEGIGVGSFKEQMEQAATILTPLTAARLYLCLTSRMVWLGRLDDVPWASERAEAYAAAAYVAEVREERQEHQHLWGMERPLVMQCLVVSFRAAAMQAQGHLQEAAASLVDAVRLARECRDIDALGMALRTLARVYDCLGEPGHAKALLLEMLGVAREYEDVGYAAEMEWRLGQVALVEGDWAEARHRFEQAMLDCGTASAPATGVVFPYAESAAISLAWLDMLQGSDTSDNPAPITVLGRALEPSMAEDLRLFATRALAERDLVTGNLSDAQARLRKVLDGTVGQTQEALALLPWQAWAELQGGAVRRAEELLGEATERARTAQDSMMELDISYVRALLAAHEGRWEQAESTLEVLLRRCRGVPYPWLEAKALYTYGQVHVARNEPDRARKTYEQALTICTRLGERLYAEHIECALAELAWQHSG